MDGPKRTLIGRVVFMCCLVVACWMTYKASLLHWLDIGRYGSLLLFLCGPMGAGFYVGARSRSYLFVFYAILMTSVVVMIIFEAMLVIEFSFAEATEVVFQMLAALLGLQTVGALPALSVRRLLDDRTQV